MLADRSTNLPSERILTVHTTIKGYPWLSNLTSIEAGQREGCGRAIQSVGWRFEAATTKKGQHGFLFFFLPRPSSHINILRGEGSHLTDNSEDERD